MGGWTTEPIKKERSKNQYPSQWHIQVIEASLTRPVQRLAWVEEEVWVWITPPKYSQCSSPKHTIPHLSSLFSVVRRRARISIQIKHQPSKGWPASPTQSQNPSSSSLPTAHTYSKQTHTAANFNPVTTQQNVYL